MDISDPTGQAMRYKSDLKIALGCVAAVAILVSLLCAAFNSFIDNAFSSYSPEAMIETVRQNTERELQPYLYYGTNAAITTPYRLEICGKWLSDILKENNNHYSIKIMGIWGDYATLLPGGTGTTEASAHVIFPDGAVVEMQYYGTIFVLCQLMTDGTF